MDYLHSSVVLSRKSAIVMSSTKLVNIMYTVRLDLSNIMRYRWCSPASAKFYGAMKLQDNKICETRPKFGLYVAVFLMRGPRRLSYHKPLYTGL